MTKHNLHITLFPLFLLFCWWFLTAFHVISPLFLPPLLELANGFIKAYQEGFARDVAGTLYRAFGGLLIAASIGIPSGLFFGYSKFFYEFFEFGVEFFRAIPVTALFPLFLLTLGIGDASKIGMISFGSLLLIIVNTMHGVHSARTQRILTGKLLRLSTPQIFTHIILMESLPGTFTGLRLALSYSLVIAVVTEMFIGANDGIGYRIMNAQYVYDTPEMYVGIITAGVLGYVLNALVIKLEKRLVHWKGV
ncbi:MAG: ABC transporter permease [Parcubacteria group bacterium]|nr:ABC transporter permease [Parcubacteria group bacterium]